MAGRKADPASQWKVKVHKANGYRYAATCKTVVGADGKGSRRYTHWGRLTDENKFLPNLLYSTSSIEVKSKLVFPDTWDLSEIEKIVPASWRHTQIDAIENRLYGDVWLACEMARERDVTRDLRLVLFNEGFATDILSLALFICLYEVPLVAMGVWQRTCQMPCERALGREEILEIMQSVSWDQVSEFYKLRSERHVGACADGAASEPVLVYVSDTVPRWQGRLHWHDWSYWHDEESRRRRDAVAYAPDSLEPVYHREFDGFASDFVIECKVTEDLAALGISGATFRFSEDPEEASEASEGQSLQILEDQEQYFRKLANAVEVDDESERDVFARSDKAGRELVLFTGLLMCSIARGIWASSDHLRSEYLGPEHVFDEMRNVRWCTWSDGASGMTPFTAEQERVAREFGVCMPPECRTRSAT